MCFCLGKSKFFETPLFCNAHNYVNEKGVGRWNVGSRSSIIYHDITLATLTRPTECELFKQISRTEVTTCKTQGSTTCLPPLFVFLSSNERVQTHRYEKRDGVLLPVSAAATAANSQSHVAGGGGGGGVAKKAKMWNPNSFSYESQLAPKNKRAACVDDVSLSAIRNRILEAYCRQIPAVDKAHLPTSEEFTRNHVILGTYGFILDLLEKYEPTDFYSSSLLSYVLQGLVDQSGLYTGTMPDGEDKIGQLNRVLLRMVPSKEKRQRYVEALCVSPFSVSAANSSPLPQPTPPQTPNCRPQT